MLSDAGRIEKGKAVEVFKGRKVAKGTKGIVRWIGSNRWGYSVGLAIEGQDKLVFTALDNVRLDESQGALAAEIEAAHESALYVAGRLALAADVEANVLPSVKLAKGDKVTPKSGTYAGRVCRVIWVGARPEGVKVGVVPVVKPVFPHGSYGRPAWPTMPADWLNVAEVA
jgi:hypothetical protein